MLSFQHLKPQNASKATGNMLLWSCEQSNWHLFSITNAKPLWLPIESALMLPEVLPIKITTL